jgi:hypothetical protein
VASELGPDASLWADQSLTKVNNSVTGSAGPPKNLSSVPDADRSIFLSPGDPFFLENSPQALLENTAANTRDVRYHLENILLPCYPSSVCVASALFFLVAMCTPGPC